MTYEAIINRIRSEADNEVRAIEAEAACELTDIRNLAEQKAEDAYNHRMSEGWREIRQYIASQQSKTRIEAKRLVREAKEDMLQQSFTKTSRYLKDIRKSDTYPVILRRLLDECVLNLGTADLLISVHPADRDIVREIIDEYRKEGYSISLSTQPVDTDGGVIGERVSDRVIIDNTIEARFSRMHRDLIVAASEILFQTGES